MKRLCPFAVLLGLCMASMVTAQVSLNGFDVDDFPQRGAAAGVALVSGLKAIPGAGDDGLAAYLEAEGLRYVASIGGDAALVVPMAGRQSNLKLAPIPADAKITPALRAKRDAREAGEATFTVFTAGGPEEVELAVGGDALIEGTVVRETGSRVGLRVDNASLKKVLGILSANPNVYAIQESTGARLLNETARRIVQSGTVSSGGETIWARGIRGEGQIIAIMDTGADPLNCYLAESDGSLPPVVQGTGTGTPDYTRRKIVIYNMLYSGDDPGDGISAFESQGHGTYVSGNAAASKEGADAFSTSDTVYNGMAPGAQLVIQDGGFMIDDCADLEALGCPVIDMTDILDQAYAQGARIHNNSWGDRENLVPYNTYTAVCADMDDATRRNRDFLIVCAAGNSGSQGNDTVASPSTAKNVISAAGVRNPQFEEIISFSSIGWAADGRIKPDVAAPATTQTSAWTMSSSVVGCNTTTVSGTSMASPMTAGAAALVRQYYEEGWYPSGVYTPADAMAAPSAALVKATLINGAQPVADQPAPPSRRQGWGRINLENSLYFDGDDRHLKVFDSPVAFGSDGDAPFEVMVSTNGNLTAGDLKVTLVYTDYPAIAGASPALINDLDLTVTDGSSNLYLGNEFDVTTGFSITGGTPDDINNVEGVRLAPAVDVYTIRVDPITILHPQDFSLVISGGFEITEMDSWLLF